MPSEPIDRRKFAGLALCGVAAGALPAASPPPDDAGEAVAAIEARTGGRIGMIAIDGRSGRMLAHRADERFPMLSTHKVAVAAAMLVAVDAGRLRLEHRVRYGPADLLDYAPVTRRNSARGAMTVAALCEAAVRWSDNTADNLLLRSIGGPAGWTRFVRAMGDAVSRLDRIEPALNTAIPGDPRDSSTPRAVAQTMRTILFGTALSDASRTLLLGWMRDPPITAGLFRAGLPAGWHVADKSGSGERGSRADAGILYRPDGSAIMASVMCTGSNRPMAELDAAVASCARIIAGRLA